MKSYIVRLDSTYEDLKEWEKAFVLNDRLNEFVYMDPDNSSILLYQDLVQYLNIQEEELEGLLSGKYRYTVSFNPFGIRVEDDENGVWFLKSDQLGFSAIGSVYQAFIDKADEDDKELARKNVSKWIFESRSIGGGFLWPMDYKDGNWICNPQYNKTRGRNPIQDRVDMTLLDIRNCFCEVDKSRLLYQFNKREHMKKWLLHFGKGEDGFKKYIEFFSFSPFIDEIDGFPKELSNIENKVTDFWDCRYTKSLSDYDFETLKAILSNLNFLIVTRSKLMEDIISKNSNREVK